MIKLNGFILAKFYQLIVTITTFYIGEGPTPDTNDNICSLGESFIINFTKANTRFCLSLNYNYDNSYLFVNRKEIYKFKADNKKFNFPTQFCLGNMMLLIPGKIL